MNSLRLFAYAAVFLLAVFPTVAPAQSNAEGKTLWLVLADVQAYSDSAIPADPSKGKAVAEFEQLFRSVPASAPPFTGRKLWRLSSSNTNGRLPNADLIRELFSNPQWGLMQNAQSGDSVIFIFGGAGVRQNGQHWLLPQDTIAANWQEKAIPVSQLDDWSSQLSQRGIQMDYFLLCDFGFVPPSTISALPGNGAAPASAAGALEGWVVFNHPPAGKSITHRVVLQDDAGRQLYLSWPREITESMQDANKPQLGTRLAVNFNPSAARDEEGSIPVTSADDIQNLGVSSNAVWPPRAELSQIDESMSHKAVWTEGRVTDYQPGNDPVPTFMTLEDQLGNQLQVVHWSDTNNELARLGKIPQVGDTIRIGGLVQMYRGNVQLRFHHANHLGIMR